MFDAVDKKDMFFKVQSEEHPIIASPSGAESEEFVRQRLAEPMRILRQGSGDELNDRGSGLFR
ncbi:hypothetical protein J2790_003025 [Paenarthrobacter nicotinovorans]|nr:hypothetical protein [Paenarthrobacter nicotinovorans]BCW57268.1 hypothetical protein StoSoilB20_06150 [Arthrobacter sp. StoSoilB20]